VLGFDQKIMNKTTHTKKPITSETQALPSLQPAACNLQPAQSLTIIEAHSIAPPQSKIENLSRNCGVQNSKMPARRNHRRHGRVARLPRVQRDMVNRMLWNGIPYKNIVAALDDAGFAVSEKNISNWATGGHLEWRLEQEAVLDNRLNQEYLLSFLRRDDAPELPEVGLQAAATRLSQVLLAKLDRADDPEANLENYTRLVELLCRLNRELGTTQKSRDDSRRTLGREYDPVHVQDVENVNAIEMERNYSNPCSESELPRPSEPPLLPEVPTATFLAGQAAEERHERELLRLKESTELMKRLMPKATPPDSAKVQRGA
jgi:hypothetical protein